jgi:large subunit ribosomal protein L22
VKLRHQRLKELAQQKGVTVEQLAAAVVRTGLDERDAMSAVRNWLSGRDHPRCKSVDVAKLAAAVGVPTKEIARFVSRVRFHRGSPRKARLLADLIRGHSVEKALNLLAFNPKRAAVNVRKCLSAAIAEAQTVEADEGKLIVSISTVDEGPRMKRFNQKDRGRAHQILKCFSHITVAVEERGPKAKKKK